MAKTFDSTIPNRIDALIEMSKRAGAFIESQGLDGQSAYTLNMAIEEIVSNVIKYAYEDDAAHTIMVRMTTDDGGVSLRVEDDGRAFNPLTVESTEMVRRWRIVGRGGWGLRWCGRWWMR